jgi:hypothetical protein
VVEVLLQALTPKQRKASNMHAAYCAACSSGCLPVLQLLLGVAAAAPAQQLPVLLQAAAEVGNLDVWRMLLQADSPAQQEQQQQQEQAQHQEVEEAAAAIPRLDWSCLSLQDLTSALNLALPSRANNAAIVICTSRQWQSQASEDARRLKIADLLWQLLVVQQGREAALREFLRAPAPSKRRGTRHPLLAADAAAEASTDSWTARKSSIQSNSRVLFGYGVTRDGYRLKWWSLSAAQLMWLQQHQLLPTELHQLAYIAFNKAVEQATKAGDFSSALQLYRILDGLDEVRMPPGPVGVLEVVVEGSICGHLRRACAAGDAAAVAQLERLAGFASNFYTDLEVGDDLHNV